MKQRLTIDDFAGKQTCLNIAHDSSEKKTIQLMTTISGSDPKARVNYLVWQGGSVQINTTDIQEAIDTYNDCGNHHTIVRADLVDIKGIKIDGEDMIILASNNLKTAVLNEKTGCVENYSSEDMLVRFNIRPQDIMKTFKSA